MMQPDYIGCDYYGWNYANLEIAHHNGVTASPNRVTYEVGNCVMVLARNTDRQLYGFLATVTEVAGDKVSSDYWPTSGEGANDYPVNRLTVHTPITLIPANLFSQLNLPGIKVAERPAVAEHLREQNQVFTPLPTDTQETVPVPKVQAKKEDLRIGYLYVIENLLGDGYKIGITDNIHRRFKQLEVAAKRLVLVTGVLITTPTLSGSFTSNCLPSACLSLSGSSLPMKNSIGRWAGLTQNAIQIERNYDEPSEEPERPTFFRRMRNFIVGSPTS